MNRDYRQIPLIAEGTTHQHAKTLAHTAKTLAKILANKKLSKEHRRRIEPRLHQLLQQLGGFDANW